MIWFAKLIGHINVQGVEMLGGILNRPLHPDSKMPTQGVGLEIRDDERATHAGTIFQANTSRWCI